ncbi:MAG: putative CDP-diacylglycerol--glycerol-3-phosphate 3-phosphatidyl-transferase 2 [Alphaproteobacteria bacterium MarineAlpha11_Bin1]|nr:MAG: putative CDP-diacylglycerol--glycerol-3-phosphate 3-phosphatidyl-transferase 2 [Alphaproteobacteria bacterium MarineAlpha11_Bin1]
MNLPNLITFARLLSVPIAVYLIMQSEYLAAFVLFAMAGISDALDGYLAKKKDQTTQLGAILDPIADKTLLVGVYLTLGLQGVLPTWLVVLVVFRDLLIVGGVMIAFLVRLEVKMHPLVISKINTAAQLALAAIALAALGLAIDIEKLVDAAIYVVAATTVISGASYIVSWTRQMTGVEHGPSGQ